MDRRLDQLVVHISLLEHLLQQKFHYEHERHIEVLRLERFKREGANERRIKMQMQVIEQVQRMMPEIVYELRNERDRFERFLRNDKAIETLNENLYKKSWQLISTCRENLERT